MVLLHGVFKGQIPPPKFPYHHMTFSPYGIIQSVSYSIPKLSLTYNMLPKNHMKYPLDQLHKFPVQRYFAIVSVLN